MSSMFFICPAASYVTMLHVYIYVWMYLFSFKISDLLFVPSFFPVAFHSLILYIRPHLIILKRFRFLVLFAGNERACIPEDRCCLWSLLLLLSDFLQVWCCVSPPLCLDRTRPDGDERLRISEAHFQFYSWMFLYCLSCLVLHPHHPTSNKSFLFFFWHLYFISKVPFLANVKKPFHLIFQTLSLFRYNQQ